MSSSVKVLLDECVTRRVIIKSSASTDYEIRHTVDIKGLGWGAKDEKIVSYLLRNSDCMFVTADRELMQKCLELKLQVGPAVSDAGIAYFFQDNELVYLGDYFGYDNYHVRYKDPTYIRQSQFRRFFRMLRRRIIRRVKSSLCLAQRIKIQSHKPAPCTICGLQCRTNRTLENHLNNDHRRKAAITKVKCNFCTAQCHNELRLRNHVINSHKITRFQYLLRVRH